MIARRLAPLALIPLLSASCGDKDKSSSATTTTTQTPTTTVSTGPSGTTPLPAKPSSKANRLFMGKRDVYPLLAGNLSRYVSSQVRGGSVSVVQVAGIDSFWAGRSDSQRILVKVKLKGKNPPLVHAGQQVDFVGTLKKASPQNASSLGVKDKTGQPVLQNQGVYLLVSVADLKLH